MTLSIEDAEAIIDREGFAGLKKRVGYGQQTVSELDKLFLVAAAIRDEDFQSAIEILNSCTGQSAALQLFRARIHFENQAFDSARAQLDVCDNREDPRWVWLNFCVELSRLSVDSSTFIHDVEKVFRELTVSAALASEYWQGHRPLQAILELKSALEGHGKTKQKLSGRALVEALFKLAVDSEDWLQEYASLRFQILLVAGQRLVRLGYRDDALTRVSDVLELDSPNCGPDQWLIWGQFLKAIGEQDEKVLEVYRTAYSLWQGQHKGRRIEICPAVALDLATIYAEMGYLVEARALLFGFYDLGLRGQPLKKLLRQVLLREAYGQDEEQNFADFDLPDSLITELPALQINRESLSLLFIKAERCFENVGENAGLPIMQAAKALKDALRSRDWDSAREHETTLARLVVRLDRQLLAKGQVSYG